MKTKKLLSLVLAVIMMLSVLTVGMTVSADTVYSDVNEGMWSYADIVYVSENGLMNGTGGGNFSPAVDVTRAMVVTVLYRMEGSPSIQFVKKFEDVEDRQFYSDAVTWAKENGIVTATSISEWGEEYFSPTRAITRQELATMFARYAAYAHVITESDASLDKFTDKASVADWATAAMKWATGTGLINGTGNGSTLSPTMTATREQFAAIIHRFNTLKFDYELAYETPEYGTYTEKAYPLVEDADVYVSVDGSDSNPGTLDKPLATFDGAVAKVRELKKTAKDEIVVAFKAGNYGTLKSRLTADDTGTAEVPIKYCAYGDGEVIFSNGIEIKESDFVKISDTEKSKFTEETADKIYKYDISGYLTDGMDLSGAMMFSTTTTCNVARYPNFGALTNFTDRYDDNSVIFTVTGIKRDVDKFGDLKGAKVMGYFKYEWLGEEFIVESYDSSQGILRFEDPRSGIGYEDNDANGECNHSFYMYDFPAALDYKGEYYIDREAKVLYAYDPKGNYLLAIEGDMLWLEGNVDHVSFVKLTLQGTTGVALYGEACDYITIDQCKVYGTGGEHAVGFSYTKANYKEDGGVTPSSKYVGSSHLTITNNEFCFMAKGAFRAYGANRDRGNAKLQAQYGWGEDFYYQELVDDGSLIENNSIHDFGWGDPFNSSGISVTAFFGLDVRHNEIYNAAREAVGLNGQCRNMNFEYNVIHDAMQQSDDGGAFYHGRSHEARGNVIRYNLFYDIPTGAGKYAIYLDDGMTGQEVYANVFYNAGDVAILMNGGRDNYIHDNIIIDTAGGRRALWTNDKYYGSAQWEAETGEAFSYPSDFVSSYTGLSKLTETQKKRWMEEYPIMFEIIADHTQYENPLCYVTPVSKYENNYMLNKKQNSVNYFDFDDPSLKFATFNNNKADFSLEENIFFVDPTHGNYAIKDGVDFMDNHYEKIGRY